MWGYSPLAYAAEAAREKRDVQPKPPKCEGCPLRHLGLGFVSPEGPPSSPYILIGEGPGENEATYGTPFFSQAPSGWRLNDWLSRAGIPRRDTYITNAIRCFTVKRNHDGEPLRGPQGRYIKRDPTAKEVLECASRHLFPELENVLSTGDASRRIIIPIGKAAQFLLTGLAGSNYTGSLQEWNLQETRQRLGMENSSPSPSSENSLPR